MKKSILALPASAAICTALAFSAVPATSGDDIAQVRAVGTPVNCVSLRRINETDIVDSQTIDFKMAGGKVYRNTLPYSCPGLKLEDRFSYRTSIGQLCNVDMIRVLEDWGGGLQEGASCGLGKFQQIEKVKS